jgi:hypothetical protein
MIPYSAGSVGAYFRVNFGDANSLRHAMHVHDVREIEPVQHRDMPRAREACSVRWMRRRRNKSEP